MFLPSKVDLVYKIIMPNGKFSKFLKIGHFHFKHKEILQTLLCDPRVAVVRRSRLTSSFDLVRVWSLKKVTLKAALSKERHLMALEIAQWKKQAILQILKSCDNHQIITDLVIITR